MRLIDADALKGPLELQRASYARIGATERAVAYADCLWEIAQAPTIGGWISVKDRLPEEHADENLYEFEQFLCATVWDNVRMVGFGTRIGDDKPHFWSGNSIWDNWVTHWQPLPKPPEEVSGDG